MKIIEADVEILTPLDGQEILKTIERAARTCYKSEDRITSGSAKKLVKNLIEHEHEAMLEHYTFSVKFTIDRGVSHEIVRHRIASYAQESTRYCNYSKDGFGNEITVIKPCFFTRDNEAEEPGLYDYWRWACEDAEKAYFRLLEIGATPQEARSVLPNSLKTELVMTANLREWRHFFKLRCAKDAHPQIREVAIKLLNKLKPQIPVIFDDLSFDF